MPKVIELRQDRALLSENFDGYKLSLEPLPVLRHELSTAPLQAETNDDQYSFLHAELFSMQNLLQADPWCRSTAYFINENNEIVRCAYDENTGRPLPQAVVYVVQNSEKRIKGDYNYSLRFVSEKYCVICDGIRNIYLLDTGDRQKAHEWKLLKSELIAADETRRNFIIYDCRLDTIQEQKQISLALGHIERIDTEAGGSNHYMQIYWARWIYMEDWILQLLDILEGKGSVYYCAFEPRAAALVLCSNRDFEFCSNKSKAANNEANATEALDTPKPQLHEEPDSNYTWTQTKEEILIKLQENDESNIKNYTIKSTANALNVKLNGELLLDISLYDKVDEDLTTWAIEAKCLQVTLIKDSQDFTWPFLEKDGKGPAQLNKNIIPDEQQPIANLEAPIEDCDFPMGTLDNDVKIVRFHIDEKESTHVVLLGSQPPLFSTNLRSGFPNAIATRSDVDASLWLMQYNPSKPDTWSFRHEGNLHAFGYVQASKQQKKFIDCAPDLSYSIICESHKHIFLYKAKYDTANGLRHRNGPQVSIGKQHLITLEDTGEVLGLSTAANFVIILTKKCVLFVQIN